jgi:predicted metal-dependent HD superfamily phosphohydrolase
VNLLRAAATHSTDAHKTDGMYGSEDLHFFLDIDMAVLGSSPEHYSEYVAKIQQEYAFLPETIYRSLRLKVGNNHTQQLLLKYKTNIVRLLLRHSSA